MSRLSTRLLKTGATLIAVSTLAGCVVYPAYPHPAYYHPYYYHPGYYR